MPGGGCLKTSFRRDITKRCALRTIAEAIVKEKSQIYGLFSQNARIYGRARIYTAGFVTLQTFNPTSNQRLTTRQKKVGNNRWKVMRHMKKLLENTSTRDLLLKRILILVFDYPVYPISLSRTSCQISPKIAIHSFEQIFDCQIHAKRLRLFLIKS